MPQRNTTAIPVQDKTSARSAARVEARASLGEAAEIPSIIRRSITNGRAREEGAVEGLAKGRTARVSRSGPFAV